MPFIHIPLIDIDENHRSAVPDIRAATDEGGVRVDPSFLKSLLNGYGANGGGIAGPTNTHDGFFNDDTGKVVVMDARVWRKMKTSVLSGLNLELNAHSEIVKATFSDAPIRKNAGTPAPLIKGVMKMRSNDGEIDQILRKAFGKGHSAETRETMANVPQGMPDHHNSARGNLKKALDHVDAHEYSKARDAHEAAGPSLAYLADDDLDDDPGVGGELRSGAGFNRRTMSAAIGSTGFAKAMEHVLNNPRPISTIGKIRR